MITTLAVLVGLALLFDFLNGLHDSSNVVSTMISSRALSPRQALTITAVAELAGPFLFGVAVATTIGAEVLSLPASGERAMPVVLAALVALVAAVLWNLFTWYRGIPSSSSHALLGGLIGAALTESTAAQLARGLSTMEELHEIFTVVHPAGLIKILLALLLSPPLGFAAGYLLLRLIRFFARAASPKVNALFKRGQIATAVALALSHGTNDAQKTMGIITMGLVAAGVLDRFAVPLWVVGASAIAIAAGTATGGWRLIRTLGGGLYKIRPVHGFTSQSASAVVILGAALLGGPVSTTQVVASAIMGAGSAERFSKVRWHLGRQIGLTWIVTLPATAAVAAVAYLILRRIS